MTKKTLAIVPLLALFVTAPLAAQSERFELGAGFLPDPQVGSGTAGGPREASGVAATCQGSIAASPNHILVVTSEVNLEIYAESSGDTTLVVTGNGGTYCADSGHGGQNPSLTQVFRPGTYQIFVGSKSGTVSYEIGLTEAL